MHVIAVMAFSDARGRSPDVIDLEVLEHEPAGIHRVHSVAFSMANAAVAHCDVPMQHRDPVPKTSIDIEIFDDIPWAARNDRTAWDKPDPGNTFDGFVRAL